MNNMEVTGLYTGELDSGKASGKAKFTVKLDDNDKWVYDGTFKKNAMDGTGNLKNYPLTIEYDGKKINGIYEGDTLDGKVSGKGKFVDDSDDMDFTYEGEFKDGHLAGEGELDYDKYVLHFKELDREGHYEGTTSNGFPSGNGKFTAVNNDGNKYTYDGEWKDGRYNGQGSVVFSEHPEFGVIKGKYTDGEFTPTLAEQVAYYGTLEFCSYNLSDEYMNFISRCDKVIEQHEDTDIDSLVNNDFSLGEYKKNPNAYGASLVYVKGLKIIQIKEYEDCGRTVSFFIADSPDNDTYYCYYFGHLDGVVEDSYINMYYLPCGYSTYKNVLDNTVWAICSLAAIVK